jgi:DNA-binding NarL/FixJ family response regulator
MSLGGRRPRPCGRARRVGKEGLSERFKTCSNRFPVFLIVDDGGAVIETSTRLERAQGRPCFLVVDDEPFVARSMERWFGRFGSTRAVTSAEQALAALRELDPCRGLVLDYHLGSGTGLDVLEAARERHPHLPALILTGRIEPSVINRAAALGARFVCKPLEESAVAPWASAIAAGEAVVPALASAAAAVEEWARLKRLTPREAEILLGAVTGHSHQALADAAGISLNTLKTHIRHLLEKSGAETLGDLARVVTHRVFFRAQEHASAADERAADAANEREASAVHCRYCEGAPRVGAGHTHTHAPARPRW